MTVLVDVKGAGAPALHRFEPDLRSLLRGGSALAACTIVLSFAAASQPARADDCFLDRDNDGQISTISDDDGNADSNNRDSRLACGVDAEATDEQATAVGSLAKANGLHSSAFGYNATATGDLAIAIGSDAVAGGTGTVVIGANASAAFPDSTAIGNGALVLGVNGIAIGAQAFTGEYSVAIGSFTQANNGAVAVGTQFGSGLQTTRASATGATAIGSSAEASDTFAVAIGSLSSATGEGGVAVGAGRASAHWTEWPSDSTQEPKGPNPSPSAAARTQRRTTPSRWAMAVR